MHIHAGQPAAGAAPLPSAGNRHFTHLADLGPAGVESLIERALAFKQQDPGRHLAGRLLAMLFFNASLRTRASFEAAMQRGGGGAVVLDVGNGVWQLETQDGVVMNGARAEHIREAAPVLGRYADALAVRVFASLADHDADNADAVIRAFREYSGVPVVNMESAREHPCQGLADLITVRENFGTGRGLPVTLTWAPHVKPLPRAVPNSFLLTAAAMGCQVRVAHPPGFELHSRVLEEARALGGPGAVTVTHDQEAALAGSAVVYAKAWGPCEPDTPVSDSAWMIDQRHLAVADPDAVFLHCLPVRRNVEVADRVLDGRACRVVDQAENRLHAQRAVLDWIWNG